MIFFVCDWLMIENTLISGSTNFFSTSQSKQEKKKSDGPKGKTPEENEGKWWIALAHWPFTNFTTSGCDLNVFLWYSLFSSSSPYQRRRNGVSKRTRCTGSAWERSSSSRSSWAFWTLLTPVVVTSPGTTLSMRCWPRGRCPVCKLFLRVTS